MFKGIKNHIENPTLYFILLIFPFFLYYSNLIYWRYWLLIFLLSISIFWLLKKSTRLIAILFICYCLISVGKPLSKMVEIPTSCAIQIDNITGILKSKEPDFNNEVQLSDARINCQSDTQKIPIVQLALTPEIQQKIKWLKVSDTLEISNFRIANQSLFAINIIPDKNFRIFNISRKKQILSRSRFLLYIQKKAEYYLSPTVSALFQSIITADKTHLSKQLKNNIRIMGIAHIFAISGLHIGIIYYWLALLLRLFLWLPLKYLNRGSKIILVDLISVFIVFGYILVIGTPVSATRAFIMLCWWCLIRHFLSWQPLPFILTGTAVIILIHNPLSIGMLSFQLSFISVLGIIMILPFLPITRINSGLFLKIFNYLLSSVILCSWLFLVNLPLVSYINPYFTLTSIVTNTIHVAFLGFFFLPLSILTLALVALSYPVLYFPGEYYLFAVLNFLGKIWEYLIGWSYSWHKLLWWEFSGNWGVIKSFLYWGLLMMIWLILKKNESHIKKVFIKSYNPNSANS
jgi:ComEC/Rec2-related protein